MKIQKKHLVFIAKFTAIFLFLEFIVFNNMVFIQEFIAQSQAQILGLESVGRFVFVKDGAFEIVPECTGIVSTSILAGIVFSLRKPELKKKLGIFFAGFLILLAVNYLRVMGIIWLGNEFGMGYAEIMHITSWFATSGIVLALWYYFTKKISGVKSFSGFL